jgi:hypothetical protein
MADLGIMGIGLVLGSATWGPDFLGSPRGGLLGFTVHFNTLYRVMDKIFFSSGNSNMGSIS